MNNNLTIDIKSMEGRTYVIGREGHIYIDSASVSKHHAEIKITNGRIYLRDLNSTNGTYLIKNKSLVYFEEGYVNPLQPVLIGDEIHTVQSLLAIVGSFADSEDTTTQVNPIYMTANSRA